MADQLITGTTILEDKRSGRGEIWSCTGIKFQPEDENDTWGFDTGTNLGYIFCNVGTLHVYASVELPNGVTIKEAVVHGNDTTDTWELWKVAIEAQTSTQIAGAAVGTVDTTITNPIVDNSTFAYFLHASVLADTKQIHGAIIKYEF